MEIKIRDQNMVNLKGKNRERTGLITSDPSLCKRLNKQLRNPNALPTNLQFHFVRACMRACVRAGVPHLLRSVLHTVTLGCVCPGAEHSALGQPGWLTGGGRGVPAHSQ